MFGLCEEETEKESERGERKVKLKQQAFVTIYHDDIQYTLNVKKEKEQWVGGDIKTGIDRCEKRKGAVGRCR